MDDRAHPRPVERAAGLRAAPRRSAHPISALQRRAGNRAVQHLLGEATKSAGVPEATKAAGVPEATKEVVGSQQTAGSPSDASAAANTPLVSPRFASDPLLQACRQGRHNFRWGSRGDSVVTIQQALVDLGYALPRFGADGEFGGETHQAVYAYQRDHGLVRDGVVGRNTIGSLDEQLATAPPTPGTRPPTTPPTPAPPTPGTQPPTTPPTPAPPTPAPPTPAPPGPTFDHPDLQAIWVASTLVEPGTDQQQQAFEVLDVDATGPWQHLQWTRVRQEAARRVFRPSLISQETLNVCGPATIAHMQADLDPVGYAAFVRQVFETATIDGDRANDELLANRPAHRVGSQEDMAHVDWMLLSCMRDTENAVFDYEGTPTEDFSAMTMPGEMAEWMEEVLGCVETEHYTSYLWGEVSNAQTVSNLMRTHGDGVVVAMLVDADALEKKDFTLNIPTHWIRLLRPIDIDDDRITVHVYTWGSERTFVYDEDQFEDVLFEFVVGARRPGIDL